MSSAGLVALHTQALAGPVAPQYCRLVQSAINKARLSKQFPDRRAYARTLNALAEGTKAGLYPSVFIDARAGLPNLASMTRVVADQTVARGALPSMTAQSELDARRRDAEVFERLARKRPYYESLVRAEVAPIDAHRVLLRRHEPEQSRASFRVELTKLTADGRYVHVAIELTQTSTLWSNALVDLDAEGEVAEGTEALRGMVYRFASFDAEALLLRLVELPGVAVERVTRGVIGPLAFVLDDGTVLARPADDPQSNALAALLRGHRGRPALIASFASDAAAIDIREDRSNDPLSALMSTGIEDSERARYDEARRQTPFRVYKDRKFAASPDLVDAVKAMCAAAGTNNIVYPLPAR